DVCHVPRRGVARALGVGVVQAQGDLALLVGVLQRGGDLVGQVGQAGPPFDGGGVALAGGEHGVAGRDEDDLVRLLAGDDLGLHGAAEVVAVGDRGGGEELLGGGRCLAAV